MIPGTLTIPPASMWYCYLETESSLFECCLQDSYLNITCLFAIYLLIPNDVQLEILNGCRLVP